MCFLYNVRADNAPPTHPHTAATLQCVSYTMYEPTMPRRRVRTPVEQLQPLERGCIVGLREDGWTYRQIAAHVEHNVLVVCRCFQQWSVEHFHVHRPGSGRPHSTDARQAHVAPVCQ